MSYCTSGIFQSYAYMGLEHSESLEHATSAFVTCNDIRNLHSEKWCVPSKKLEKIEDIYLGTKYYNNILTLKDDIFCVFLANGQLMRMFYTNQCYDSTQNLSRWSLIPLFLDYCLMDGLFCSELDLGHHNCRIQLSNDFSSIYTFDCLLVVWSSTQFAEKHINKPFPLHFKRQNCEEHSRFPLFELLFMFWSSIQFWMKY